MNFILSQNSNKSSTDVTESFNFNLGTTFNNYVSNNKNMHPANHSINFNLTPMLVPYFVDFKYILNQSDAEKKLKII